VVAVSFDVFWNMCFLGPKGYYSGINEIVVSTENI
jgi:hypothetical protein